MMRSLKSRVLIFFLCFLILTLGSLIFSFLLTERRALKVRANDETAVLLRLCETTLQREIAGAVAEVQGLRMNMVERSASDVPSRYSRHPSRPIREWLKIYVFKYTGVALFDSLWNEINSFIPVREFNTVEILPKSSRMIPAEVADKLREQTKGREDIVTLFDFSATGELNTNIAVPAGDRGQWLVAVLPLETVIASVRNQVALPAHITMEAADGNGTIFFAEDISGLLKPLPGFNEISHNLYPETHTSFTGSSIRQISRLAEPPVTLVITGDLNPAIDRWRIGAVRMAAFSLLAAGLAWVLVNMAVRAISASIEKVSAAVMAVARGRLDQRIAMKRDDELGVLINSFNEMAEKLEENRSTIQSVNLSLEEKIAELTRARAALTRKERLAVLGEAVSKISHEMQNRVSGVHIWVHNLLRSCKDDPDTLQTARELEESINGLLDTLAHFKQFYRMPDPKRKPVKLAGLIDSALLRLQPELQAKRLRIQRKECENDGFEADGQQIIDALYNILINAVYYSPEGSCIHIETMQCDDVLKVRIIDEGPGIGPGDRENLFEPFYSKKQGGSGLGLAIVKNIVQTHGGEIKIMERTGSGAGFELLFAVNGQIEGGN